jgi:hypothetical protein
MKPKKGRIIKHHKVEITGSVLLEIDTTAVSESTGHAGHPAQARIIEQHADRAILEVTCGCGQVVRIQCDYAKSAVAS